MNSIIIIPVYKKNLHETELIALKQCLIILKKYDICLIAPKELDLGLYDKIFYYYNKTYIIEYFNSFYFDSINGYNKLMLNKQFYERFHKWDYMLIYQLDAYVFRDELELWCNKGYDYIGAPWMNLKGEILPNYCGNGGFSLRKIETFINLFNHKGNVLNRKGLSLFYSYRGPLHKPCLIFLGLLGYKNKLKDYIDGERVNEDLFFASLKGRRYNKFNIPDASISMFFSFEIQPRKLFQKANCLPFGCHGWAKYDYEYFWKEYIKL